MENYTIVQLKEELGTRGLDTSGTKADLTIRLLEALAQEEGTTEESMQADAQVDPEDSASVVSAPDSQLSRSSLNTLIDQIAVERVERASLDIQTKRLKDMQRIGEEQRKFREGEARLREEKEILDLEYKKQASLAKERAISDVLETFSDSRISVVSSRSRRQELNHRAEAYYPTHPPIGAADTSNNQWIAHRDTSSMEPKASLEVDKRTAPTPRPEFPQTQPAAHSQVSTNIPTPTAKEAPLMDTLISYNLKSLMPKAEVQSFSGDVTQYRSFIRSFESIISSKLTDEEEKLFYLEQYTSGRPREIVRSCNLMEKSQGYKEARRLLHRMYGDDEKVATAQVDKILKWPHMEEDDVEGFSDFYIMLRTCYNTLSGGAAGARELENPSTIRKLTGKLPRYMVNKWRRKVRAIVGKERTVQFEDLLEFIDEEIQVMSDPLYGVHLYDTPTPKKDDKALRTESKTRFPPRERPKEVSINTVAIARPHDQSGTPWPSCIFCNGQHYLDECKTLRAKPIEERLEFLQSNSLCFSCLRKGHLSRDCLRRKTCLECKRKHPTLLHRDPAPQEQASDHSEPDNNTQAAGVYIQQVYNKLARKLSVIPIKVRDTTGKLVSTLAFLDSGSTSTFCTKELLAKLNVTNSTPTQLSLGTVEREGVQIDSLMIAGLEISDLEEENIIALPRVFALNKLPVTGDEAITKEDLQEWPHLSDLEVAPMNVEVGMLIGIDVPQAVEPLEVKQSPVEGGPFAFRSKLGWIIHGYPRSKGSAHVKVNKINIEEVKLDQLLTNMYNHEFQEANSPNKGLSEEDKKWKASVEDSCCRTDHGHYEIGLPFLGEGPALPNNKQSAIKRLEGLKNRFLKSERFYEDYRNFMSDVIDNGYAEPVPQGDQNKETRMWYIPHHGVYHHQKPDKLRVVLDCAARCKGTSLNDKLLQGPDLANPLVDVIQRFRCGSSAFTADIKSMFYQVKVPTNDRDYLRFLWWAEGNLHEEPKEYRMTVHPFGARSSPSCANYALRKTVIDYGQEFSAEARNTIMNNFYVDDCLKSVDEESEMVQVAHEVRDLCARGGFKLTKFVSNSRKLLESLDPEELDKGMKELDLGRDSLPTTKALGICWNTESDTFTIMTKDKRKPLTKRGLLSVIGSMFDPLGMVAPFVLNGRLIMQEASRLSIGWDETLPEPLRERWSLWVSAMPELTRVSLDRCIRPKDFGRVVSCQLHHFCDASERGYGSVSYLRISNDKGNVHCAFVFGKVHVTPLKAITIPRLELTAATTAVKVDHMLDRACELPIDRKVFWTDSTTVLRYIRNDKTRFHTFVANRLSVIHDGSRTEQWRYVNSNLNPADDATRGNQSNRWLSGPEFLYLEQDQWPCEPSVMSVTEDDLEVKGFVGASNVCNEPTSLVTELSQKYSSWFKLKKAVAWLIRCKRIMKKEMGNEDKGCLSVKELEEAEELIIRAVQGESFSEELSTLKKREVVKGTSSIIRLKPFLLDGLLRVGGRLANAPLNFTEKHPLILPNKHRVTELIIRDCHEKLGHQGREHVLSLLKEKYWIIKGNAAVRKVLGRCLACRRYQAPVMQQRMSDLPADRICSDQPPFTSTGIDCFGPFYTKRGRSEVKRYGVLFTCLTSRAIHIEVAEALSTDSFINCLRRFMARRGPVKTIHCDRGTNFVGAEKQLKKAIEDWDQSRIHENLLSRDIQWNFNPPHASHFGGVWERQIRTIRKVLNGVMKEQTLTDESLSTLMCEVEAIINSRPLTTISDDCHDPNPLTPNHLLTMKGGPYILGEMSSKDMYCKRRWRHIQYLAELFWKRWKKLYLLNLQERQKWHTEGRNLSVGDVVLLVEENAPRCHWPLGLVTEVKFSQDGLVRSATLRCRNSIIERPVSKLILMCAGHTSESQVQKPPQSGHSLVG